MYKPDLIVSPTHISEHIACERKAILKQCFKGSYSSSTPGLMGNFRHELFQRCLALRDMSDEMMDKVSDELIRGSTEIAMNCDLSETKVSKGGPVGNDTALVV